MMHLIIQYAYTDSVPVTVSNVEELLVTADHFRVTGLIRGCCDFLQDQLCLENCVGIWRLTDFYYCPDLKQKAFRFILHHFEEMVQVSEEFLELPLSQLAEILEQDELNVKKESAVFEVILRWIAHMPEERKGEISVLLPKVRLALLTPDYFMANVNNNELLKESRDCKLIITSALKAMYDLNLNRPSDGNLQNPLSRPRLPYALLFAIGGWSDGGPTNGIEVYDTRTDHWVNVTHNEESPRAYHAAAFLNGVIYCIGGFNGADYFNSVRKFDLATRTWHEAAPMHSPRCYVSVTVLDGCIYAMGGFNGRSRLLSAERYEPDTNQWTVIAPMHEQRSDAGATTLGGKVYICGGFTGNDCLQTAECYDPEADQWSLTSPMSSRRSGVGTVTYGGRVFAVGGFDGLDRLRSAEAFDPETNSWSPVSTMLHPRSNFGIGVVDDLLFVVGGFNGISTTFGAERYDRNTDEWRNVEDMQICRSALSCCVVHGLPNVAEYVPPRDSLPLPRMEEEEGEASSLGGSL
ncbi:kelch-like protein 10 [Lampris incognitus]|uniref:kelch-like protein 10 n=1 Tax=Lampris incognitus TaxID=2546036 RepID=UPI0024B5C32B|nr:kelch-like protein 10 [Lampris incognitus]